MTLIQKSLFSTLLKRATSKEYYGIFNKFFRLVLGALSNTCSRLECSFQAVGTTAPQFVILVPVSFSPCKKSQSFQHKYLQQTTAAREVPLTFLHTTEHSSTSMPRPYKMFSRPSTCRKAQKSQSVYILKKNS